MLKCVKNTIAIQPAITRAPRKIDFYVNGACNFNCAWCWGPAHDFKQETMNIPDWIGLAARLKFSGLEHVVITGGEPLLKTGIIDLIEYLKKILGLRVTLSTHGLFYPLVSDRVSPLIDEIGLPLEGFNQKIDNAMRPGDSRRFDAAINTIKELQNKYPHVEITVRTVVSKLNLATVHLIGSTIIKNQIDPARMRWKLYQCTPLGPRKKTLNHENWLITDEQFEACKKRVISHNPEFPNLVFQSIKDQVGRYLHIYPDGKTRVISKGKTGLPLEKFIGNINRNFYGILDKSKNFLQQKDRS